MKRPAFATPIFGNLDETRLRRELGDTSRRLLRHLTVLAEVDSTNLALQRLAPDSQHAHALIADRQTAGRGRRGRTWHSPSGYNIYLSLGWRFPGPMASLTQLPLAVAVAAARALRRAGVRDCVIKWPNDVLVAGRKLAGILVELRRAGDDEALAVMGVGVNLGMPPGPEAQSAISQPWTELCAHLSEPVTTDLRNRVCGLLIDELLMASRSFSDSGFQSFVSDWSELDVLRGREVSVESGEETFHGIAVGTSDRGGLLLARTTPAGTGCVQELVAGEVSVRLLGA